MIPDDPDGAVDYATGWASRGGGDEAGRCKALAEIALGDAETGANVLDRLAHGSTAPVKRRALFAADAARAWLLAAKPDRALESAGLALTLDPLPSYEIAHARAALGAHRPAIAIGDLSPILAAGNAEPADRTDALVVRAAAFREIGVLDKARTDIDAACRIEPDAPEVLLERGILRESAGDLDGARQDWSRVLSVAPDTHEADLAQQDLALLDAGPEAR